MIKFEGKSTVYANILRAWQRRTNERTPVLDAYAACGVVERILDWVEPPASPRPPPPPNATFADLIPVAPLFQSLHARSQFLDHWLELACTSWRTCAGDVFSAHLRDRVGMLKVRVLTCGCSILVMLYR